MIGLAPDVCIVIGTPSARAPSQSRLMFSIVRTPREAAAAPPPMVTPPRLREQIPSVSSLSLPDIQSRLTRASPARSIGASSARPTGVP